MIRRQKKQNCRTKLTPLRYLPIPLFFLALVSVLYLYSNGVGKNPEEEIQKKLYFYFASNDYNGYKLDLSSRIKDLIKTKKYIGDGLNNIKIGSSSADKILGNTITVENKSPMTMEEIFDFLISFLHQLHDICLKHKEAKFREIWKLYHDLALDILYPWDQEYLKRMPKRKKDGNIFVALASYRDEYCLPTLKDMFRKAKHPEKLIVGLVQQNCYEDCKTGVLENLKMEPTEPDEDCHLEFCASPEGKEHCDAGRFRVLRVNETESLGPYFARYMGSKLWYGEEWYMQIDSHMTFAQDWDTLSIAMLQNAPSDKPVISHYPPDEDYNFEANADVPGFRLCGGVIADTVIESQIVRLQLKVEDPGKKYHIPRFANVIAAGYFISSAEFLIEVPFDPFLPWIFMGEEIIMSARMWTHGYDIFAPSQNIIGHYYGRKHKPKFWENTHRVFQNGVHNPLQKIILNRVKYQIGYPEASRDMIVPQTIFTKVEDYSMGKKRKLEDYLELSGFNLIYKLAIVPQWCIDGVVPPFVPEYQQYASLYSKPIKPNKNKEENKKEESKDNDEDLTHEEKGEEQNDEEEVEEPDDDDDEEEEDDELNAGNEN